MNTYIMTEEEKQMLRDYMGKYSHFGGWRDIMFLVERIIGTKYEDGENAYFRTFGMYNAENGCYMTRINRYGLHEYPDLKDSILSACVEFVKHEMELKGLK